MVVASKKFTERSSVEMSPGIKPEVVSGDMITVFDLRLGVRPVENASEMAAMIGVYRDGQKEIENHEITTAEEISERVQAGSLSEEELLKSSQEAVEGTNTALVENDANAMKIKNILAELFNETGAVSVGKSQKVFEIKDPRELVRLHAESFKSNEQNVEGDNMPNVPISHFFVIAQGAGEILKRNLHNFNSEQYQITSEFPGGFIARFNDKVVAFLAVEDGQSV